MSPLLRLFVYGSLKMGECNDFVLKRWVEHFEEARTQGEMRLRPDRYPSLFLPTYGELGSVEYARDVGLESAPACRQGHLVKGQLLYLREGREALPVLDHFEGYFPGGRSEYLRVAVSVETRDGLVPCWTYTGVGRPVPGWPLLQEWPPPGMEREPEPFEHGL